MNDVDSKVDTSGQTNEPDPAAVASPPGQGLMAVVTDYFKKAGVVVGVWGWGYFRMSSAWLLLGLFFYCGNERYRAVKEKKRSFLTKAAREDEKKAILSSIDELPSWVSSSSSSYYTTIVSYRWVDSSSSSISSILL